MFGWAKATNEQMHKLGLLFIIQSVSRLKQVGDHGMIMVVMTEASNKSSVCQCMLLEAPQEAVIVISINNILTDWKCQIYAHGPIIAGAYCVLATQHNSGLPSTHMGHPRAPPP